MHPFGANVLNFVQLYVFYFIKMSDDILNFFIGDDALPRTIVILCKTMDAADPISRTITTMMSSKLQLRLTEFGLQLFQSKDLTFPYHMMSHDQREIIRHNLLNNIDNWNVYQYAITYTALKTSTCTLDPFNVLHALCRQILDSPAMEDVRWKVAICNIILQRVQASIPVDKKTQQRLNSDLFAITGVNKIKETNSVDISSNDDVRESGGSESRV